MNGYQHFKRDAEKVGTSGLMGLCAFFLLSTAVIAGWAIIQAVYGAASDALPEGKAGAVAVAALFIVPGVVAALLLVALGVRRLTAGRVRTEPSSSGSSESTVFTGARPSGSLAWTDPGSWRSAPSSSDPDADPAASA